MIKLVSIYICQRNYEGEMSTGSFFLHFLSVYFDIREQILALISLLLPPAGKRGC